MLLSEDGSSAESSKEVDGSEVGEEYGRSTRSRRRKPFNAFEVHILVKVSKFEHRTESYICDD